MHKLKKCVLQLQEVIDTHLRFQSEWKTKNNELKFR